MHSRLSKFALPVLLLVSACSSAGKPPVVASSGENAAYAVHYDDELTVATKGIADTRTREKTLSSGFAGYVDQMKKPDWQKVELVIDQSDEAGKSADFAEAENDATAIHDFWESEKGEIDGRVAGATAQKLKEANCSGDVGGTVSWALNDAITKQLQKRLRAKNEAFVEAVKKIMLVLKSGRTDEGYSQYADLLSSDGFAEYRPDDQRQALKLLLLAKAPERSDAVNRAYQIALQRIQSLVDTLAEPADYEMLGVAHLQLEDKPAATSAFEIALKLERARNPQSDLCASLGRRIAQLN